MSAAVKLPADDVASAVDWKNPDYGPIFAERAERLEWLREHPAEIDALKAFYKNNPARFISDWGMTYDPRNAEIDQPTTIPFVLFVKQVEFIGWLHDLWRGRRDGLCEKSRDMGVTWLCVWFAVWLWLFYPGTVSGFGSRKEEYVDKIGDPKSIFWKARQAIELLPEEFQPAGWSVDKHAPYMRIVNPENGSTVVGEAGDNIGRGNRTSIYFKDESAFYEHADAIDAALSQTSNCKIDVSTPNGAGNAFYRKRHGGRIPVFVFDWKDDPRKDKEWYRKQLESLDKVIVAQEIDRDYEGSVTDSYIDGALVTAAQARGPTEVLSSGGLRVGIDPARFGDDKFVVTFRRGRVCLKQVELSKLDTVQGAARAKAEIDAFNEKPEQIAVEVNGLSGAGTADLLRGDDRFGDVVVDVNTSLRMSDGVHYNMRAYMYKQLKEWLPTASIPNEPQLKSDLTALKYGFRGGELLLESKDDMKARGIKSPDRADSLALTFALPAKGKKKQPPKMQPFRPLDPGFGY